MLVRLSGSLIVCLGVGVDAHMMGDGRVVSVKESSTVDQREPADRFVRQCFVA